MKLYRYVNYSDSLHVEEYEVKRETKCFYIIIADYGLEKRVSKDGVRRFAYPDKKDALNSFAKRKESQINILENQLSNAKTTFEIAKRKMEEEYQQKFRPKSLYRYDYRDYY